MSLGRGLNSLIPQSERDSSSKKDFSKQEVSSDNIFNIPVKKIQPNPGQPRNNFAEGKMQELVNSIKEHGLLQPLVLKKVGEDKFQIIAGERRFRACKRLKKETVPAILREVKDDQQLELSLIENIQRQNLNPIEKAKAYKELINKHDLTQEDISKKLGKSRSSVANTLRLLKLDEDVKEALKQGKISEGHARLLLSLDSSKKQKMFLRRILGKNWSVKETKQSIKTKSKSKTSFKNDFKKEQKRLSDVLDTKVKINKYKNKTKIIIEAYSKEDINRIMDKIS